MTDKQTQASSDQGNMKKDPESWVTGEEPMTGAQRSYLKTLSEEARQPFDVTLTKAAASRRIDELQALTGRHPPAKEGVRESSIGAGAADAGKGDGVDAGANAGEDGRQSGDGGSAGRGQASDRNRKGGK